MTMNITPIDKATRSQINSFELQDVTQAGLVRKSSVKVGLLEAMFGGSTNVFPIATDKLTYDELVETVQIPTGKRFDEVGGARVKIDTPKDKVFRTGSYGVSANVSPADVSGKRKFNSDSEFYTVKDHVADLAAKMDQGWKHFTELSFSSLLRTDTNEVFGGPATAYNFYTDIYGTSRAAATDIATGTANVEDRVNALVDQLQENCAKAGTTYNSIVMLCNGALWDKLFAYEKTIVQAVAAIDKGNTLDLTILAGDRGGFAADEMVFQRRHFTSDLTGVTYIRVSDTVDGVPLIGANTTPVGFLVPLGADNMFAKIYSPAQTMQYVNTQGLSKYSFVHEDDRKGITLFEECNTLFMNRTPNLIIPVTSSN